MSVLLELAAAYDVGLQLTRESSDDAITRAFRCVSAKVHPDKGGSAADAQRLNATRDQWRAAGRQPKPKGRPAQRAQQGQENVAVSSGDVRVQSVSVLLT